MLQFEAALGAAWLAAAACFAQSAPAGNDDGRGAEVFVVYNSASAASKKVADHYASARKIPAAQILGLSLPETETISRDDFESKLQQPLWRELTGRGLFRTNGPTAPHSAVSAAEIRYAVLCFGVPVKIAPDNARSEPGAEKLQTELRRNEAAVDSELAALPMLPRAGLLAGPAMNPAYGATNREALHPTNGVLMVARLDGPSAEIAAGLADKAMAAERDGLWGRAYFDWRGLNEGPYRTGDEWIKTAHEVARGYGFETVTNASPATFAPSSPLSDIALYFGWYDQSVSGPFTNEMAEFRPGAIAYHLHSFSARALRVDDVWWAGPLLARGATATLGCTEEPYLEMTPHVHLLAHRLMFGRFSFGEAAYACQRSLSWQNTVVGDPLYAPFALGQKERYEALEARKAPEIEWSMLMWINVRLAQGAPLKEILQFYETNPTGESAVLQEKLGDIYKSRGKLIDAMAPYGECLKLKMGAIQRLRVTLSAASLLSSFGKPEQALELYEGLIRDYPNYAAQKDIYEKMAKVASRLGKTEEAARYEKLAKPDAPR